MNRGNVSKRYCVICGNLLSRYNRDNQCFCHLVSELEKEIHGGDGGTDLHEEVDKIDPSDPLPSSQDVLNAVADYFSLDACDLLNHCRVKSLVWARQVAMYILRTKLHHTLPQIATDLSRDHTTVMHGVECVTQSLVRDARKCAQVSEILLSLDLSGP